ncbi:unnamed protein product [Allacma fusca]|uniref:Uncharacterized protein n=1 Tax=Allacma fusca TaxID=39272 RepID=A0A8J2L8Y1_9HEXA|nr:unnamed protein product [Allacma fusca]
MRPLAFVQTKISSLNIYMRKTKCPMQFSRCQNRECLNKKTETETDTSLAELIVMSAGELKSRLLTGYLRPSGCRLCGRGVNLTYENVDPTVTPPFIVYSCDGLFKNTCPDGKIRWRNEAPESELYLQQDIMGKLYNVVSYTVHTGNHYFAVLIHGDDKYVYDDTLKKLKSRKMYDRTVIGQKECAHFFHVSHSGSRQRSINDSAITMSEVTASNYFPATFCRFCSYEPHRLMQEKFQDLRKLAVSFIRRNIQELGSRPEYLSLNADEIELLLPAISENQTANTNQPEDQESVSNLFVSIYKWMTVNVALRVETFCSISAKFPLSQVDADILRKIFKEDKNLSQNSVCVNLYLCAMERKYFEDREMYHRTGSLRVPPVHVAQHPSTVLSSSHDSANEENNYSDTRQDSGTDQDNFQGGQRASLSNAIRGTENKRKRLAENPDIILLEEVPCKRNTTTAIDFTEFGSNVPTAEAFESGVPKMYFISGSSTCTRSVMEMNLTDFSTKTVTDFPFEEECACLMHHDNKIIAICNKEDTEVCQVVRYLSLKKKIWVEMSSFSKTRFKFGWTIAQNSIYVLGGLSTTGQIEASVEKCWDPFSVVNCHWTTIDNSPHPRADHAVGLVGHLIYVVGGVRGSRSLRISKSMLAFDIETKKWSKKAAMPSKNIGLCVAVLDSRLYAIGGGEKKCNRKATRTCAVYIPETNEWNLTSPLKQARQNACKKLKTNVYQFFSNSPLCVSLSALS